MPDASIWCLILRTTGAVTTWIQLIVVGVVVIQTCSPDLIQNEVIGLGSFAVCRFSDGGGIFPACSGLTGAGIFWRSMNQTRLPGQARSEGEADRGTSGGFGN